MRIANWTAFGGRMEQGQFNISALNWDDKDWLYDGNVLDVSALFNPDGTKVTTPFLTV